MIEMRCVVEELSNADLIAGTRELVRRSREVEADLLVYLGEIDERELYLERAHSSMHEFCVEELGFSDDIAYSRITVARAARRLPGIVDVIRAGHVHLTGVRLLVPHLTFENHRGLLSRAAGKTKGEIEELIVSFAPRPLVPDIIRKLPAQPGPGDGGARQGTLEGVGEQPTEATQPPPSEVPIGAQSDAASPQTEPLAGSTAPSPDLLAASTAPSPELLPGGTAPLPELLVGTTAPPPRARRATIAPLAEDAYKIQFTGTRALRNKVLEAQALLRHRVPNGDLASVVEMALDVLIAQVKKERFAVGRKPRRNQRRDPLELLVTGSRHIPDDIKRAVYERDDGHCTYVDERGRRCKSRDVEYDHIDGWALSSVHSIDRIRLLCRAHNQHAADKLYGREFMERARGKRSSNAAATPPANRPTTPATIPAATPANTRTAIPTTTSAETPSTTSVETAPTTPVDTPPTAPVETPPTTPAETPVDYRVPNCDATSAGSAHKTAAIIDPGTRSGTSSEERLL